MFTLRNWEWYSDKPAPLFKSRKEAEAMASSMRSIRAWVEVIEVEANNE